MTRSATYPINAAARQARLFREIEAFPDDVPTPTEAQRAVAEAYLAPRVAALSPVGEEETAQARHILFGEWELNRARAALDTLLAARQSNSHPVPDQSIARLSQAIKATQRCLQTCRNRYKKVQSARLKNRKGEQKASGGSVFSDCVKKA